MQLATQYCEVVFAYVKLVQEDSHILVLLSLKVPTGQSLTHTLPDIYLNSEEFKQLYTHV